jgi:hypothetical protein
VRYALLIYQDEAGAAAPDTEDAQRIYGEYAAFTEQLEAREARLGGEALVGIEAATTVRVRNGEAITTDGPFAETKEQLGGFYLIEAADLDEALELARACPGAWYGSVEVRPVWDWESDAAGG